MKKMLRRRPSSLVLAVLGLAVLPAALLATHSWGGYHWARTANPFNLKAGDNVSSAWDGYLDTALADWTASSKLDMTKVAGSVNPRTCKATTGRVEVCNATYGNNGWLGIAGISITGGVHITKGYVKLNDTYFNTSTYNTPAWRNLVSCQELGHTLGLDHQDEIFNNGNLGTCMDYTNDPDGSLYNQADNQYPNRHDYDELDIIYQHLDSTTTVGRPTGAGAVSAIVDQLDQNHPAAWGRLVDRSEDGGQEVYELDLGGGNKQLTFVTWTLEEAARRASRPE